MAVTGQDIVDCARTYLDTPWKHQGRTKGVRIDCAGLIACVQKETGAYDFDYTAYTIHADANKMAAILDSHYDKVCIGYNKSLVRQGDIIVIAFGRDRQHLGFHDNGKIIHAYSIYGKVCEQRIDDVLVKRIREVRRIKGITE